MLADFEPGRAVWPVGQWASWDCDLPGRARFRISNSGQRVRWPCGVLQLMKAGPFGGPTKPASGA
eukprot:12527287-Alexandrium_andersonii.AAC.1